MLRVILIAVFTLFLLSDVTVAQQNSRRGRFFQRVKQDLFGIKPATPTPSKKVSTNKPTPSSKATKQPNPSRAQSQRDYSFNQRATNPARTRSNSGRKDFGFVLQESKSGQLIVSKIDARGNAAEAGLVRGDRVIEVGGIEANSVEEFEGISKIMQNGDQMEFKIKRNGREKTVMITYGEAPDADEDDLDNAVSKSRRFDFSPPDLNQERRGSSILDTPAPGRSARSIGSSNDFVATRNAGPNNAMVSQLRGVIERQNQQIRQLQAEIANLKRYGR